MFRTSTNSSGHPHQCSAQIADLSIQLTSLSLKINTLEAKMEGYLAPLHSEGKLVTTRELLLELQAKVERMDRRQMEMEFKVEGLSDSVLAARLKDDDESKDSGERDDLLDGLEIKCKSLDSKLEGLLDLVKLALAKSELVEKVVNGRIR